MAATVEHLGVFLVYFGLLQLASGAQLTIPEVKNDGACDLRQPQVVNNYTQGLLLPGYDNFHFVPSDQKCSWLLQASPGKVWKIRFLHFDLGRNCAESALELFSSANPHQEGSGEEPLDTFCGNHLPTSTIFTPGRDLFLKFRSGRQPYYTGYQLYFEESMPKATCRISEEIQCRNQVKCAGKGQLCNGLDECLDGTDEENCESTSWAFCGLPAIQPHLGNDRVVGGREAVPGSWPWQASLRLTRLEPFGHMCGGVLIHPQWILTAGHCFREYKASSLWTVGFGKHKKVIHDSTEQVRYMDTILVHPGFRGNEPRKVNQTWLERKEHDIALVKLNAPVVINPYTIPVCLPEQGEEQPAFTTCHVTGWGYTHMTGSEWVLKQASVPLVERQACQQMYPYYTIGDSMLCAGFMEGGHDACQGDSGGPLVHQQAGRWQLGGVVSTGGVCGAAREPGIYTQVSKYVDWIKKTIDSDF